MEYTVENVDDNNLKQFLVPRAFERACRVAVRGQKFPGITFMSVNSPDVYVFINNLGLVLDLDLI